MPTLTVKIPGGRLGNFLAGAAVASVIGGTAVAFTAPNFTYSAVLHGYHSISPQGMVPFEGSTHYNIGRDSAGWYLGSPTYECFSTMVNVPQGASIDSVTTSYWSDARANPSVVVVRLNLLASGYDSLVSHTISDDAGTRKVITYAVPTDLRLVNNGKYAYAYWICIDNGTFFYGARVNYTYTSAGD